MVIRQPYNSSPHLSDYSGSEISNYTYNSESNVSDSMQPQHTSIQSADFYFKPTNAELCSYRPPINYSPIPAGFSGSPPVMASQYAAPNLHSTGYGTESSFPADGQHGYRPEWSGGYSSAGYHRSRTSMAAPYAYNRYNSIPEMSDGDQRKNTTRESTNMLKSWLQEHNKNPYPSKGEKIMLAIVTKMTLTQVSTWFANARRRLKKENKMTWAPKNRCNELQTKNESKTTDDSPLEEYNENKHHEQNEDKEDFSNSKTGENLSQNLRQSPTTINGDNNHALTNMSPIRDDLHDTQIWAKGNPQELGCQAENRVMPYPAEGNNGCVTTPAIIPHHFSSYSTACLAAPVSPGYSKEHQTSWSHSLQSNFGISQQSYEGEMAASNSSHSVNTVASTINVIGSDVIDHHRYPLDHSICLRPTRGQVDCKVRSNLSHSPTSSLPSEYKTEISDIPPYHAAYSNNNDTDDQSSFFYFPPQEAVSALRTMHPAGCSSVSKNSVIDYCPPSVPVNTSSPIIGDSFRLPQCHQVRHFDSASQVSEAQFSETTLAVSAPPPKAGSMIYSTPYYHQAMTDGEKIVTDNRHSGFTTASCELMTKHIPISSPHASPGDFSPSFAGIINVEPSHRYAHFIRFKHVEPDKLVSTFLVYNAYVIVSY
ncbi:unnamed protein product [Clavelina lepadiformis]|uniref:Homeobox domain-containing protein n=1 Tax=Clavelina lepadiformis TaxID=159417 RepID=A0ABP0G2C2_CLALP